MAIAYMRIQNIGRGNNRSVVAAAAYRSGTKLFDQTDGLTKNYEHKQKEVVYHKIFLPPKAPPEHTDAEILWNAVQIAEITQNHNKKNCRFGKQLEIALPIELSLEENIKIIDEFVKPIISQGYGVQVDIHNKEGNPHVHILIPPRPYNQSGSFDFSIPKQKKDYVYILDEYGNRIPELNSDGSTKQDKHGNTIYMREPMLDAAGKQVFKNEPGHGKRAMWKRVTISTNYLDDAKTLETWKQSWETICNKYLIKNKQISFSLYSNKYRLALPYSQRPIGQIHLGPATYAMYRKGKSTDKLEVFKHINLHNKIAFQLLGITRTEWNTPTWKPQKSDYYFSDLNKTSTANTNNNTHTKDNQKDDRSI